MYIDEQSKSAKAKLARAITSASSLTTELADMLIDWLYIYPDNQIEIVWKADDFCTEGM